MDVGFYLFSLPFFSAALGFASAVILVCLGVTVLVAVTVAWPSRLRVARAG